jgi:hypothetical protein
MKKWVVYLSIFLSLGWLASIRPGEPVTKTAAEVATAKVEATPVTFLDEISPREEALLSKRSTDARAVKAYLDTQAYLNALKVAAEREAAAARQRLRASRSQQRPQTAIRPSVASNPAPAVVGSTREIGQQLAAERGWTGQQWICLDKLWTNESGWNTYARNRSSGAYGIPQALPGSKMATAGSDWQTNPATQIKWGLGYIAGRYSTPCGAWSAFLSRSPHWY